ncbi:MAG: NAD(P)H-hydrate dehydratase [Lachnospiraceae bacterium]|nr:NAD(P)H-hydrate dehydratase [Lachnospiraceae bacterium]
MEFLLNAKQMKECDNRAIHQFGIPSPVLMERAALAVVEEMKKADLDLSRVLVVCGSGNNGGDGFAVARILKESSDENSDEKQNSFSDDCGKVTLAFVGRDASLTEETALQKKICENCGIKISRNFKDSEYTTIVDAIFGIGLSRTITGEYANVIQWINEQPASVVAVDIPSGISADNGRVLGSAVRADLTVTFAGRKIGQILYPGAAYCGKTVCREIGIPADAGDGPPVFTYTDRDLALAPKRIPYSNKGTYGKVLLIAGSKGMSGAACLAARAAYRTGCGIVRVFTPECNREIVQISLPEAIVTTWNPDAPDMEDLFAALDWSDTAGIGPGLSTSSAAAKLLGFVLKNYKKPLVIDADALNLLSADSKLLEQAQGKIVMTPHIGEMSRLIREDKKTITEDIITAVKRFAQKQNVVCALKDARTAVSDGERVYLNTSGNNGMATAGSGDVLTGIICGLLAQGMPCFEAAALGVYIHGLAGDRARDNRGACGVMAGDIADQIGLVLR